MAGNKLQIVSLEDLKRQMRIDFEEDDNLVLLYGVAAEEAVVNLTRRSVEELVAENRRRKGDDKAGFPPMLYVAVLMLAAQLYKNRDPVSGLSQVLVPYTLDYMVKPWIKLAE